MSAPTAPLPAYIVNAFTRRTFGGNPAAVVPLPLSPGRTWPEGALMQEVAAQHHLSETAFLMGGQGQYDLRWFTPAQEVDFCGHATLASAWVLWRLGETADTLAFRTRVGTLRAERAPDGAVRLDLPRLDPRPLPLSADELGARLGVTVREVFGPSGGNFSTFAVLESAAAVRDLTPDWGRLGDVDDLTVTAPGPEGSGADFVSRCFAPGMGVPEDPVTGSAHCTLAPYWAARLGKETLTARQLSRRGGELECEVRPERVRVSGHAVLYAKMSVHVPELLDPRAGATPTGGILGG